ncbi:hypothetical protein AX16_009533 [Volvariella volvacea WC 439]|nr:hypothetical protein AX16_009533 [Volvariella volvacea WC 439]
MPPQADSRRGPVIVITGTPGTGKSTHAQLLVDESPIPLKHINISELVKEKGFYEEYDEEWQSYIVDEDKVRQHLVRKWNAPQHHKQLLDELEPLTEEGGVILDWHTCEAFPERWPDLVVVLRCNHTLLWERLEKRYLRKSHYPLKKIQENNEAEIMQVVLEEAKASYPPEIVVELSSDQAEDLQSNMARMVEWINNWMREH